MFTGATGYERNKQIRILLAELSCRPGEAVLIKVPKKFESRTDTPIGGKYQNSSSIAWPMGSPALSMASAKNELLNNNYKTERDIAPLI